MIYSQPFIAKTVKRQPQVCFGGWHPWWCRLLCFFHAGFCFRVCFSITEAVQKFAGSIPAFVISGLPSPVFSLKYILTGSHDLRPFFVIKCDRFHSINICLVQTATWLRMPRKKAFSTTSSSFFRLFLDRLARGLLKFLGVYVKIYPKFNISRHEKSTHLIFVYD